MLNRCVYFFLILAAPLLADIKDRDTFFHHLYEGKKYFNDDEFPRAIQEFSTAILIMEWTGDFSELSPYTLRANVYFLIGDHESAIRDYSAVIRRVNENNALHVTELIKSLCGRCFCYGFLGNEEACNRDFKMVGDIFAQGEHEEDYQEFLKALEMIEFSDLDDDDDGEGDDYSIYWIIKRKFAN